MDDTLRTSAAAGLGTLARAHPRGGGDPGRRLRALMSPRPGTTAMPPEPGRTLRVLCVSNMWPGPEDPDLGVFVRDMCAQLRRRGAEVEVAAIATRRRGRMRTPLKYLGLALRAARPSWRADVLYAHGLFPAGAVAGLWGRLAGRPWVVTAHGQDVRNMALRPVRALSAPALRRAAAAVAVSGDLAAELRATGVPLPPLHVIDMGVDLDRFAPGDRAAARRRLGLPEGPLVLAVGGLTERKNPLRLLQAFALLAAERPDARLAYVGDGPLAGALERDARGLGVGPRVVRAGAVDHGAIPDWMRACDVLALPSLTEPLGQVALEALACGRPVVATRAGGTREFVTPEVGAVVDPLRPREIARALAAVLAAPPSPEACRAAAAGHGLPAQAARVHAVLAAAAAGARPRRTPRLVSRPRRNPRI